jgi:hypothetical protein
MDNGWIKLHRKILEWEWWSDPNTFRVFMYLLLTANHEDKRWQGIEISRGQTVTSLSKLAKECKLTVQSVRTSITHLKSTGELTQSQHRTFSLLTLIKYSDYQSINTPINTKLTRSQHEANNKQECKNVRMKEDKKEELTNSGELRPPTPAETMRDFIQMIEEKTDRYNRFVEKTAVGGNSTVEIVRAELDKFVNYWCELTRDGKRQRWETEKVFEVKRRLMNWLARSERQVNKIKKPIRIIS